MKEESKLIELFKKYPGIAARIRRSFAYHYDHYPGTGKIQTSYHAKIPTLQR